MCRLCRLSLSFTDFWSCFAPLFPLCTVFLQGDVLLHIDGAPTHSLPLEECANRIGKFRV